LSYHVCNLLTTNGIEYVRDLVMRTPADLLRIYNFGRKAYNEVQAYLSAEGLQLCQMPQSPPPPTRFIYEKCPHCGGSGRTGRRLPYAEIRKHGIELQ
jgi:hypothetical protein